MLTLIQPWFTSDNAIRNRELHQCLNKNLAHPLISKVILLAETDPPFEHEKLYVAKIGRRATFNEAIQLIEGIGIVANTDIYFDDTLQKALKIKPNQCYALSRIDVIGQTLKPYHLADSQDAWIFNNPQLNVGHYSFGVPGCDNRLAHEIKQAGYKITNPCLSINVLHLHKSGYRTYTEKQRLKGHYLTLQPTTL